MTGVVGRRDRLVGRDDLQGRAEAALVGGGVVLHGPTGVGKSALARATAARLGEKGSAATWVQGTPGMASVPLGALLPHLVRGSGASPAPAASELGRVDTAELARRLLRALPGRGPLVVVDDLQWVDDLTVAVVHHLLQVDDVRVLATVREGERLSPAAMGLGRDPAMTRVEVAPLDPGDVGDLVAAVLGGPADAGLVDHLVTRTEGNPLFVTELLAGAEERGVVRRAAGTWRLVGDLVPSFVLDEVVTSRLDALDADSVRAAEVLALAEWLPLADAEEAVGLDALDALDRAGLVRTGDEAGREVVGLAHPVHGEVLRARLGSVARRRHLRALVAALGDLAARPDVDRLRGARWALASGAEVDPAVAAAAGRLAFRTFDVDLAERLARLAWEQERSARAATLLAEVLHSRGDHDTALALLAEARPLLEDEHEAARGVAIESLGLLHGEGDPVGARRLVQEGRAPMVDVEARLALYVAELYVLLMSETFDALDEVTAALHAETPAHTTVASRQLVAATLVIRGRHEEAVALISTPTLVEEDLFVRSQDLALMAGGVRALALLRSGRVAEGVEAAEASHRRCVAEGDQRSRSMAAAARAIAAHMADDTAGLTHWSTDAVDALDGTFAPNLECLAQALALMAATRAGDTTAAAAARAALDRLAAETERLYAAWSAKARALSAPDPAEAARSLLAEAERYLALGAAEYAADLAHEAAAQSGAARAGADRSGAGPGGPARGIAPAALAVVDAAAVEGPLGEARRRHVAAIAAGDPDALAAAADTLAALGCARMARLALDAAASLAPEGQARRMRRRAEGLAGAAAVTGGADRPTGAWASLTPREQEVAALVARGLRSKEVAAELHLSPRTVDGNLQRVYAKLGIDDRRALARLAAELGLPAAVADAPSRERA